MPTTAFALAPVILAAVLATAAVGKLRAPSSRASDALVALNVPRWLRSRWLVAAHPWAEIVLATGLVLTTGWLGTAFAVGAGVLFTGYLVLIARAATKPEPVDCDCFGALGAGQVTRVTVARNVWYVVIAAFAIWAHAGGTSPLAVVSELGTDGWWWVAAAAAVAVTVGLTMSGQGQVETEGSARPDDDLEDYLRTRTPAVTVVLGDGTETDLRQLSARRAQLLLFVSEGCGPCTQVIDRTPRWREQLPELDIRHVVGRAPEDASVTSASEPRSLHDPDYRVRDSFGMPGTPSALLLGRDGLLAGGPVTGIDAVQGFVEEIMAELHSAESGSAR